jgi:hypothetical protein
MGRGRLVDAFAVTPELARTLHGLVAELGIDLPQVGGEVEAREARALQEWLTRLVPVVIASLRVQARAEAKAAPTVRFGDQLKLRKSRLRVLVWSGSVPITDLTPKEAESLRTDRRRWTNARIPRLIAHGRSPRHPVGILWRRVALAGNPVPVGIEPVWVTWICPEHCLSVGLALEVPAVVAIALAHVGAGVEAARHWS